MPRPEKMEWPEEQQWLLSALDLKFRQQEAVIRALLAQQPLHLPPRVSLPALPAPDAPLLSAAQAEPDPDPASGQGLAGLRPSEKELEEMADNQASKEAPGAGSEDTASRRLQRKPTTSLKHVMHEVSEKQPDPPFKAWVKGPLDGYMGLVVMLNLIMIALAAQSTGHEADVSLGLAQGSSPLLPDLVFEAAEYIFFVIYTLDVLLRVVVLRREWYYDDLDGFMFMNIFDAALVLLHAFELTLLPVLVTGDQDQRSSTIRVIKLMRIVRTLRIIKTVTFFRQLRVLVMTCLASIGALFWSMVMLFIIKVGFALIICQAIQGFILDDQNDLDVRTDMNIYFGSFLKALYTMFELTYSGSWPLRVRPVVEKVSPWYALLFLTYITLVVFAVIRVVTALFLKETLASAANDADMQLEEQRKAARDYQQKLEDLFKAVDEDGNDWLSAQEFLQAMNLPSVQRYMSYLDLSVKDCGPLFEILDDGDGKITIPEFCKGLMQLKGPSKALDMVVLKRESSKVLKECQEIHHEVDAVCSAILGHVRQTSTQTSVSGQC